MKTESKKTSYDIVIIGAGICGIYIASKLSRKGLSVVLVEARINAGGRIQSRKGCLTTIQAGPEFVHGNLPLTKKLVKRSGAHLIEHKGNMYRSLKGEISKAYEPVPGMSEFMKEAGKLKKDLSLNAFLATHFHAEKYNDLQTMCRRMAEGFDAANADRMSVKSLYEEWSGDAIESSHIIKEGYDLLVQYLLAKCIKQECVLFFNEPVSLLKWEIGKVQVKTESGKIIDGKRAVITIPLNELISTTTKKMHLVPTIPSLPPLINHLGFGGVIKVVIEFRSFFWNSKQFKDIISQIPDLGFMFGEGDFPVFWTSVQKLPILTCWAGGGQAERLKNNSHTQLEKMAVKSIATAFLTSEKIIQQEVLSVSVFNWLKTDFNHSAYTYETVHSKAAKEKLRQPIKNTLFLAGESLSSGGTVESALESADYTTKKILSLY